MSASIFFNPSHPHPRAPPPPLLPYSLFNNAGRGDRGVPPPAPTDAAAAGLYGARAGGSAMRGSAARGRAGLRRAGRRSSSVRVCDARAGGAQAHRRAELRCAGGSPTQAIGVGAPNSGRRRVPASRWGGGRPSATRGGAAMSASTLNNSRVFGPDGAFSASTHNNSRVCVTQLVRT